MDGKEKVMRKGCLVSLVRSFPVRTLTRRDLTKFIVVVDFLDRNCPFQSSGLGTQVVSAGLSIKTLKGNVGSFVLSPGLSIPWVTKRSGLYRLP
jgi:hypothetical protein